jgi:hypothetical protein
MRVAMICVMMASLAVSAEGPLGTPSQVVVTDEIPYPENPFGFEPRLLLITYIKDGHGPALTGKESDVELRIMYRDMRYPSLRGKIDAARKMGARVQDFATEDAIARAVAIVTEQRRIRDMRVIEDTEPLPDDIDQLRRIRVRISETDALIFKMSEARIAEYRQHIREEKQHIIDEKNRELQAIEEKIAERRRALVHSSPIAPQPAPMNRSEQGDQQYVDAMLDTIAKRGGGIEREEVNAAFPYLKKIHDEYGESLRDLCVTYIYLRMEKKVSVSESLATVHLVVRGLQK